jgi:hypothetical protein
MLFLAVDHQKIGAIGDVFASRFVGIQLIPKLIEGGDGEVGAKAYGTGVGFELAEENAEQRGFADPVRPDDSDLVTAEDGGAEVPQDGLTGEGVGNVFKLSDEHSGTVGFL